MSDDGFELSGDSEEESEECPKRRHLSQNERIYGDFYEPPEEDLDQKPTFKRKGERHEKVNLAFVGDYSNFRAGATLMDYAAEVEVDIPNRRPKNKAAAPQVPKIGEFSFQSFLHKFQLTDMPIMEEDEESIANRKVEDGISDEIMEALELIPEEDHEEYQQNLNIQEANYQQYLSSQSKHVPRYVSEEDRSKARQFYHSYGLGFKMIQKMGFNVAKGLGKKLHGLIKPIQAKFQTSLTRKDQKQHESSEENPVQLDRHEAIMGKLGTYRSRNKQVDKLLLSLKQDFDRIRSQKQLRSNELDSFAKEEELQISLSLQKQKQIDSLLQEVHNLEELDKCISTRSYARVPSSAFHYGVHQLMIKEASDQLKLKSGVDDYLDYESVLLCLKNDLQQMYLSKDREAVQQSGYGQSVSETVLCEQDKQAIQHYLHLLVESYLLPVVECRLRFQVHLNYSLQQILPLLLLFKQYSPSSLQQVLKEYLVPLANNYLRTVALAPYFQSESQSILPHLMVFPWLQILPLQSLCLTDYYRRVMAVSHAQINASTLKVILSLLKPFLGFSNGADRHYVGQLYILPLVLRCLQQNFTMEHAKWEESAEYLRVLESCKTVVSLEGLEEVLGETVLRGVSRELGGSHEEQGQVGKWLRRWRKVANGLVDGCFDRFIQRVK